MEIPHPNNAMTDTHRFFTQLLISRKIISEVELSPMFNQLLREKNEPIIPLDQFVTTINEKLRFLSFDIRKIVSEDDGKIYWGIANTRNDSHAQLATSHTQPEINFFKKIVDAILAPSQELVARLPHRGELPLDVALNLATGTGITLKSAEELIKTKFVPEFWLAMPEGENDRRPVSLGIRSFLELKPFFEEEYQESITECVICSDLIIKGQSCTNGKCETRMHKHCSKNWFAGKKVKNCPTCTSPWQF